jgi:hypothetical protein
MPAIRLVHRRNRLWFCVAGTICVRTYPAARRLLEAA